MPTASLPVDDLDDTPTAPATGSPPSATHPAPATSTTPATAPPAISPPQAMAVSPVPAVMASPNVAPAANANDAASAMNAMPSALVAAAADSANGRARLSLQVTEAGSTAYVFPHADDPDRFGPESALMQCSTSCSLELPHGEYSIRVVTASGVNSYGELSLHSARWIHVTPANQVARDLGFAAAVVGIASTVLGTALLAEAICDTCTTQARNIGGGAGLAFGIPMTAIGWSLYFIHRSASVDEQVLTQPETARRWQLRVAQLPGGAALTGQILF